MLDPLYIVGVAESVFNQCMILNEKSKKQFHGGAKIHDKS